MSPLRLSPLALFYCLLVVPTLVVSLMDTLFDVPVSNHGARIRLISKLKNLDLQIRSPVEIGGLKSVEYSKISIQVTIMIDIFHIFGIYIVGLQYSSILPSIFVC